MGLELTVVDAFTDRPFTGNPAAVALTDEFPSDAQMQAVAREMNLSETAFVRRRSDGDHDLRWFTPAVEVDLCGHATLASAHVLGGSARFHTRSGVLTCARSADGWIEMDFPADPPTAATPPASLAVDGFRWFGRGRFDALVELEGAEAVRGYTPDPVALTTIGSRAVVFTAGADEPGVDCISRVFAPSVGILEDPVTGSAHCMLGVYWGERLGRRELVGLQASARTGTVRMAWQGERVALGGRAVTVAHVRMVA